MLGILDKATEHPLKRAIDDAKVLLRASKYERLQRVEDMTKGKQDPGECLDALQRLLKVTLHASIKRAGSSRSEVSKLKGQLALVVETKELLEAKVNTKLALTRLFYSL